jgi:hypothetical protein
VMKIAGSVATLDELLSLLSYQSAWHWFDAVFYLPRQSGLFGVVCVNITEVEGFFRFPFGLFFVSILIHY